MSSGFFDSSVMRVLFDRSAFHGKRFAALSDSSLRQLVPSNRVVIIHTPVFLDETLSSFGSARAGDEWRTHMAFALDVCNGGIFLDKEQIWHNELVSGRGPFAGRLLMDLVDSRRAAALADQWERAPTRFPFYTAFVEGFLFHGYHAAVPLLITLKQVDPELAR